MQRDFWILCDERLRWSCRSLGRPPTVIRFIFIFFLDFLEILSSLSRKLEIYAHWKKGATIYDEKTHEVPEDV